MLCFWKASGSRMTNMTFPSINPIQLVPRPFNSSPQCKKSSLRHHFRRNSWKLGSQNLHVHGHFWCTCKFSFFPVFTTPRGIFGQKCDTLWVPVWDTLYFQSCFRQCHVSVIFHNRRLSFNNDWQLQHSLFVWWWLYWLSWFAFIIRASPPQVFSANNKRSGGLGRDDLCMRMTRVRMFWIQCAQVARLHTCAHV